MTDKKNIANVADFPSQQCSGCGVCAGVCPSDALEMVDSADGGYRPRVNTDRCTRCLLCQKVCPFHEVVDGACNRYAKWFPSARHFHPVLGHSVRSVLGHHATPSDRLASTSGGVLSWLLAELLRSGRVDAVYCTMPTDQCDPLYVFQRCETPEDVFRSRGSAYYPVHSAQVLREICQRPGRYAITALPCTARGIRRAMERLLPLRERIHFVLGLVCGILMSKSYARFLAASQDVPFNSIRRLKYRISKDGVPTKRFTLQIRHIHSSGELRTTEGSLSRFADEAAAIEACRHCIEPFPLAADAAFMDAWLSPYQEQCEGTSIAVVRNQEVNELLARGRDEKSLVLREASEEEVIQSQRTAAIQKKLWRNPLRTGCELPDAWRELASRLYGKPSLLDRWIERTVKRRTDKALQLLPMDLRDIDKQTFGYRVELAVLRRVKKLLDAIKK